MKPPTIAHLLAILDGIDWRALEADLDANQPGQPRAASLEPSRGHGVSDPTGETATRDTTDHHAIYRRHVDAAYRALLAIAVLAEARTPTHQPRRSAIAAETRGCTLHERAGVEAHRQAYRATDFADVLDAPLREPIPVCRWCWDFPRRTHPDGDQLGRVPTNEEILTYERTGKLRLKARAKRPTWTATNIAGDWTGRTGAA